jgi:acrylyl-CoA reductase (NADPH)
MSEASFRALMARKDGAGQSVTLEALTEADLPAADVTVDVAYSSFNYKDGLALQGKSRILRSLPMVPGIDFAGTVRRSASALFQPGDAVIMTGWGMGETWSGGFAERGRVKSEWLVKLAPPLTLRTAMIMGTAGFTAMLCVQALQRHGVTPGAAVLVTGASGGVGSVAVRLLSRAGYAVTAMTGRPAEHAFLTALGAAEVIDRAAYAAPGKPLQGERWAAAVDTVGGVTLANVLASTAYGGAVAACGLAGGADLPASVFPFILRNVALLGVDSVNCPMPQRQAAWEQLGRDISAAEAEGLCTEVGLGDLPALATDILAGRVRGRTLVDVRR